MSNKILLADDSLTIQKVVELTFTDEDYDVVVVGDGAAAIARIDQEPPDIVLADVEMPKKNGYEVCEHVKGNPATSHIPVLLLVRKDEPFDPARARRVGASGHILKPFESNVFVRTVKELLAASAAKSEAPAPPQEVEIPAATPPPALAEMAPEPPPAPAAYEPPPAAFAEEASPFEGGAEDAIAGHITEADGQPLWGSPASSSPVLSSGSDTASLMRDRVVPETLEDPFAPLAPEAPDTADAFAAPEDAFAAPVGGAPSPFLEEPPFSGSAAFGDEAEADAAPAWSDTSAELMAAPTQPVAAPAVQAALAVVAASPAMVAPAVDADATDPGIGLEDFPADVLNAIVDRVVRRMSEDVVREIAWQVVPELAELLIKKKLEELG